MQSRPRAPSRPSRGAPTATSTTSTPGCAGEESSWLPRSSWRSSSASPPTSSSTGNIHRLDITDALGARPTPHATTDKKTNLPPLNILVMGSDTRAGSGNSAYGSNNVEYGVAGARSDTNLVVHLSADRKSATVVSIPRDSMTKAPQDCKQKTWKPETGVTRQWNANFTQGGPACTIKTFEGLTGIFIDHFVVIDFRGFQQMVDALGGVTVCTPEPIDDKDSHLVLPAGKTKVNGKQALGYVRVRHSVGDGSDLGRINRQQAFLSSVVQEATKSSLLLRPDRLFRFLNAATQSMTADTDLNVGEMKRHRPERRSHRHVPDPLRHRPHPHLRPGPEPGRVVRLR